MGATASITVSVWTFWKAEKKEITFENKKNLFSRTKNNYTKVFDFYETNSDEIFKACEINETNFKEFNILFATSKPDDIIDSGIKGDKCKSLEELKNYINDLLEDEDDEFEKVYVTNVSKVPEKDIWSIKKEEIYSPKGENYKGYVFYNENWNTFNNLKDWWADIYWDDNDEEEITFSKKELEKILNWMGEKDKFMIRFSWSSY